MEKKLLIPFFLVLLIGITDASIGLNYSNNTWTLFNDYHNFYINATTNYQMSNVPNEFWSHNELCLNFTVGGLWYSRCARNLTWTWTNSTDNLTYVSLNGTTSWTFYVGRTVTLKTNYFLNTTDSRIKITHSVTYVGSRNIQGDLIWRVHDIKINNDLVNDYITVYNNSEYTDYRLNDSLGLSFTSLNDTWYHLKDENAGAWARTWWNGTNYTLNVYKNASEYNSFVDLKFPFNLATGKNITQTLWWEDAVCSWSCVRVTPVSQQNIYQGQTFNMNTKITYSGTCTSTGKNMLAQFSNNTPNYYPIGFNTNLSTGDENPQYFWTIAGADWDIAGRDDWDSLYYVNTRCYFNLQYKYTDGIGVNVTIPPAQICTNVATSQTLTVDTEACYNITASNVNFNCNGKKIFSASVPWSSEAFNLNGKDNITIRNCVMENFSGGIITQGSKNLTIVNNTFRNFNRSTTESFYNVEGIRLNYTNDVNIINNTMFDFSTNRNSLVGGGSPKGVYVYYGNNTVVRNLTSYNCIGDYSSGGGDPTVHEYCYWFYGYGSSNLTIMDSYLKNASFGAYIYTSISNVSITNSKIEDSFYGIRTYSSTILVDRVNITGNNIHPSGSSTNGMLLSYGNNNIITNLRVANMTDPCISLSYADYTILENVTTYNCSDTAIYLYDSVGTRINRAILNKSGIALNGESVQYSYFNNMYADNYTTGIYSLYTFGWWSLYSNNTFVNVNSGGKTIHLEWVSYGDIYLNNTMNYGNISQGGNSGQNFTVQEYVRFNITSGGSPLTATISANDTFGRQEYSGYTSLSPYTPLNLTTWNTSATAISNYTWSNYTITVNRTGYITNMTSWNFTNMKDWTINITMYPTPDTIPPILTWIGNTTVNNTTTNLTSAYFNVSGDEYLENCTLKFNGLQTIMTRSNDSNFYHHIAGLADGIYWFNATCNDSAGNSNITETRNFTVDTSLPVLTFVSPTPPNENITNQTWVFVNVTTNEVTKNATLNWNGTLYYMLKSSDFNWYRNMTGLPDGKFLYFAYANDSAGNYGWSEYRNVTVNTTIPTPPTNVTVYFNIIRFLVIETNDKSFDYLPIFAGFVAFISYGVVFLERKSDKERQSESLFLF